MDDGRSATPDGTAPSPRLLAASRASLAVVLIAIGASIPFNTGTRYPFAPFDMFSEPWQAATRIVVRTPDGRLSEVTAWGAWDCAEKLDLTQRGLCGDDFGHPENAHKASDTVNSRQQPLPDGAPVEIVRRLFRFPRPGGPPSVDECVQARCKAAEWNGDGD
jgi:hypothetical protein